MLELRAMTYTSKWNLIGKQNGFLWKIMKGGFAEDYLSSSEHM
jgi:hypothetical protein